MNTAHGFSLPIFTILQSDHPHKVEELLTCFRKLHLTEHLMVKMLPSGTDGAFSIRVVASTPFGQLVVNELEARAKSDEG